MHSAATDISSAGGPSSAAMRHSRVLIAAGGTGGHVYPAIAIADALRQVQPEIEILFVGTKNHMEWHAVPEAGYDIVNVWISGFHRRLTLKNLMFPIKLSVSLMQSFSIIGEFEPEVVVSCGGYVAGPVGWMGAKRGIPLVIQEQNSYPGVTNRLLAKHAAAIFTAFEDAHQFFPEQKTQLTGNPTLSDLREVDRDAAFESFEFSADSRTLLVLGGSGGARAINEGMAANIHTLHDEMELQIIWQCGEKYFDEYRTRLDSRNLNNLRLKDFIKNMDEAYAVADLVVSRAGALSCSELALTGNPSILVPSPHVAGDHQTSNARSMVDGGAAELLTDEEFKDTVAELVRNLIFDRERLRRMQQAALKLARPEAARTIATEIIELANANPSNRAKRPDGNA